MKDKDRTVFAKSFDPVPSNEKPIVYSKTLNNWKAMEAEAERMCGLCEAIWPTLEWSTNSITIDYIWIQGQCFMDDKDQFEQLEDAEIHWPSSWIEAEEMAQRKKQ